MNAKTLFRVLSNSLLAVALLSNAPRLKAQSPEPQKQPTEVQQLKERLLQLEQTVELLKTQITSMEDAQKKPDAASGERWRRLQLCHLHLSLLRTMRRKARAPFRSMAP